MGNVSSPIWHQRKLITFSNHVWNVSNARGGPLGIRHAKQKTKRKQNLLNPIFVRSWSKIKKTPTKQPVLRGTKLTAVSSFDKTKTDSKQPKTKRKSNLKNCTTQEKNEAASFGPSAPKKCAIENVTFGFEKLCEKTKSSFPRSS